MRRMTEIANVARDLAASKMACNTIMCRKAELSKHNEDVFLYHSIPAHWFFDGIFTHLLF